jgi:hypothetical protein
MHSAAIITVTVILLSLVPHLTIGHEDRSHMADKLTSLVRVLHLEDCAARVVCDLSCRPDYYGAEGKRVLRTLVKIQTSGHIDRDDLRFYMNAGMTGRRARVARDCHKCDSVFEKCDATSSDLVDVFSLIRVDF